MDSNFQHDLTQENELLEGNITSTDVQDLAPHYRLDRDTHSVQPLLDAQNIRVKFKVDGGYVEAVKAVSFQLYAGETVAIVGESGSGKSVTARTIMGLLPKKAVVDTGSVIDFSGINQSVRNLLNFSEREMRDLRGKKISMIFQEPMTSLNPIYSIGTQLIEAILIHQKLSKKVAFKRAVELLRAVQIPTPELKMHQYPHQLSGGQRQRIMIAIALANDPDILIADEPTTALDVTVQAQILNLIRDLQKSRGMSVILITHDLTVVRQFSDYVYVMQFGEVKEHNTTQALFNAPKHPYTQKLLSSEPSGSAPPIEKHSPVVLDAKDVLVKFQIKHGSFFKPQIDEIIAVNHLSLTLHKHETLGIVGESGSGKTTFGQALLRLIDNQNGLIKFKEERLDGKSREALRPLRSKIQIVFQDPFSSLNPRMSIGQIIEEGLIINQIGSDKNERLERIKKALRDAGMPDNILARFPHEFSGGQRQRIAIARAIALEPELILLDEPTSALDLSVQAQIIQLLRHLQVTYGLSYLFISHDLKVVKALCHRVIVMQHGNIVEQGDVESVLNTPQTDYTRRLVKAAFEISTE